jgi:hypothetical protein
MKLQAEVTFHFQGESVRTAGAEIRRLANAAAEVGFEIAGARIEEAPSPDLPTGRGTFYVPLDDPGAQAKG